MQDEVGKGDGDETEELCARLQTYSSFGEVSFLCNTPQRYTIVVRELCRVLRLDKQSFTEILKIYFLDGRIILNNLLEVISILFLLYVLTMLSLSVYWLQYTEICYKSCLPTKLEE